MPGAMGERIRFTVNGAARDAEVRAEESAA